jgi:predicted DNA-binding transcriptional regulator YafY
MKESKKISDTSVRVLNTLKIFSKNAASIQDIINYFENSNSEKKLYTNEVILKYINTLKVFGFKFIKNKDKYVLLNSPYKFDLDENDLKAISLIENFSKLLPEENFRKYINKFLQNLEKRFSDNTKLIAQRVKNPISLNLNINYEKYADQIKQYEKYCIDCQKLKIIYNASKNKQNSIIVEPHEIKYIENEIFLNVYNPILAQIQNINFNSIIKIEQLPIKTNFTKLLSSVTFKLKDRLAKGYKLHESERLLQIEKDESIIILNQAEDRTLLLKRLMRYGEYCEVLSPKILREEMKEIINSAIKNY